MRVRIDIEYRAHHTSAMQKTALQLRRLSTAIGFTLAGISLASCGGSNTSSSQPPVTVTSPPPVTAEQPTVCPQGTGVPFTKFGADDVPLSYMSDKTFCLNLAGNTVSFGQDIPVFESRSESGEQYFYSRTHRQSELRISKPGPNGLVDISLTEDQKISLHPEHAFTIGDRHFFVAYNVETSVPSGRQVDLISESMALWEVLDSAIARVDSVPLAGGIETSIFSVPFGDSRLLCVSLQCTRLSEVADGSLTTETLPLNLDSTGFSPVIVEIAADTSRAFALLKREYDDRLQARPTSSDPIYFLCEISVSGSCAPAGGTGTPYQLRVEGGVSNFKRAITDAEKAEMLRYDLERLRQTGVSNLGENNLEGRIVWANAYYVNGLITLATNKSGLSSDFTDIQSDARVRAQIELEVMADVLTEGIPTLAAKRYSLTREPLESLLHNGRLARLFVRAEQNGIFTDSANLDFLKSRMAPDGTQVEEISSGSTSGRTEFRLRKGIPFWSDGSNSPWNYQSGWIEGMSVLEANSLGFADMFSTDIRAMVSQFIQDEGISTLPTEWNYAGGDFYNGWTAADDVSVNTPDFGGDKNNTSTAHVSYRTMDAMALLEADALGWVDIGAPLQPYIKSLIDTGNVYPFVLEAIEPGQQSTVLPEHLRSSYRRIVFQYELQSAPWVMAPGP